MKTFWICCFMLVHLSMSRSLAEAFDSSGRGNSAEDHISLPAINTKRMVCAYEYDFAGQPSGSPNRIISRELVRLRDNLVLPVWNGTKWTDMCEYALSGTTNSVQAKRLVVDLNYWEGMNANWTNQLRKSEVVSFSSEIQMGVRASRSLLSAEGFRAEFDGPCGVWKLVPSPISFLPALSEMKANRLPGVAARLKAATILLRKSEKSDLPRTIQNIRCLGFDVSSNTVEQSGWPNRRAALLSVLPVVSPEDFSTVLAVENDPRSSFVVDVLKQCFEFGCIPVRSGEQWNDGAVRFESLPGLDDDDRRLLMMLNYRSNPYYGRVWKSILGDKDPLSETTKEQILARFQGKGFNLIREKNLGFLSLTPIEHTAP